MCDASGLTGNRANCWQLTGRDGEGPITGEFRIRFRGSDWTAWLPHGVEVGESKRWGICCSDHTKDLDGLIHYRSNQDRLGSEDRLFSYMSGNRLHVNGIYFCMENKLRLLSLALSGGRVILWFIGDLEAALVGLQSVQECAVSRTPPGSAGQHVWAVTFIKVIEVKHRVVDAQIVGSWPQPACRPTWNAFLGGFTRQACPRPS